MLVRPHDVKDSTIKIRATLPTRRPSLNVGLAMTRSLRVRVGLVYFSHSSTRYCYEQGN